MVRGPLALLVVVSLAAPAAAAGQARDCELVRARKARNITSGNTETWFISGPAEFACTDSTVVRADSAVLTRETSLELIGRVFYADATRTLEADRAVYYMEAARLVARDNVVLTDLRQHGSVVRGPRLTYERAGPERPEARTIVTGRPHATLYPRGAGEGAPGDTAAQPFEVDADWMEIRGEGRFSAEGAVDIVRGETRSGAHTATFDPEGDLLLLTGEAWIRQEDLRLEGQSIEVRLESEQLREVTARRDAHLEGRDLNVDATTVRLEFAEGALQRLIAVVPSPADPSAVDTTPASADRPRAVAIARELRLVADSIDALAPGQELRQLVAVGDAFAQRQLDSLSTGLPELVATDWVSGDTVHAYFAAAGPRPDSGAAVAALPPDSGAARHGADGASRDSAEIVLERLVVVGPGGRAQALYRVSREGDEAGRPAINYTVADRIILILSEGEIKEAEATGEVRGRYLEPVRGSVGRAAGSASGGGQPPGARSR
jgi:lipopolysaccharide export system protein LptA